MAGNIERQKIFERELLDESYRERIADKSDHKCCHCGKTVYYGYGATVDHFIPLYQGGTNRDINLIMLCENCNKKKNARIFHPKEYCRYLKEEYLDALIGYYDSYISSFDYLSRKNLLSRDEYIVKVYPIEYSDKFIKKHHNQEKFFNTHQLKRAFESDTERLKDYLYRYSKKYDIPISQEELGCNVDFWLKFGCIYYIEKNEEIKIVCAVTVTDLTKSGFVDNIDHTLSVTVFSIYSNDNAATLAHGIQEKIPQFILREQDLSQIPVRYNVAKGDKLWPILLYGSGCQEDHTSDIFRHRYTIGYRGDYDSLPKIPEDESLKKFFDKFKDVQPQIDNWLDEHKEYDLKWMKAEINMCASESEQVDAMIEKIKRDISEEAS